MGNYWKDQGRSQIRFPIAPIEPPQREERTHDYRKEIMGRDRQQCAGFTYGKPSVLRTKKV